MKKIFFAAFAMAVLLSSCGNQPNTTTDTHSHEDGSVHDDHCEDTDDKPDQEHFEVENDENSEEESEHAHSHENEENHTH